MEKLEKAAPGMSPQRYVKRNGEKIHLTKAIVMDKTKKYRKAVKKYARNGEIGVTGRQNLKILRLKEGLTGDEAEAIEADELRPYREYAQHKKEYEKCFRAELEALDGDLNDDVREDLNDLANQRSLKPEDVTAIEQRVMQELDNRTAPRPPILGEQEKNLLRVSPIAEEQKKIQSPQNWGLGAVRQFSEDLGNSVKLEMLPIPAGEFMMGSPDSEERRLDDEGPQHFVKVPAFYMGKFPITQAQWTAIAKTKQIKYKLEPDKSYFKGGDLPVEQVSWDDAIEFCDRLSRETGERYSLPSEAQWEYACRAGTTTPFHFGETIDASIANYDGNHAYGSGKKGEYRSKPTPVGHFKTSANEFGLYDMHGNVWEWCADRWHENYEGAPDDGSVWNASNDSGSKVLRGGSWLNLPGYCRSANRRDYVSDCRSRYFGFRVVSPIPTPRTL